MSAPPATDTLAPMKSDGFYNRNSQWQYQAALPVLPLLFQAASSIASSSASSTLYVADLGCSQGANSQEPVAKIIEGILSQLKEDKCEIAVCHVDQPFNDFNSLFEVLQSSPDSYLKKFSNVYVTAQAKSFHERLFPLHSYHLMFSLCALHFLSKKPTITQSISITSTTIDMDPTEKQAFIDQSVTDLKNFLKLRHRELVSGGKLVVSLVASDENNLIQNNIVNAATKTIKKFIEKGRIHGDEGRNMILPLHYRSPSQMEEALKDSAQLFKVDHLQFQTKYHPHYKQFVAGEIPIEEYALTITNFYRAITEQMISLALHPTRSETERQAIVDDLFKEMKEDYILHPDDCPFPMAYFALTKIEAQ